MKIRIKLIIIFFAIIFIGINKISAGSLSINGNSSVYVNSSINVTVKFTNIAGRFRIYSSDSSVLAGGAEDFYDNQTVTITFAATKVGSATITVTPVGKVGDYDNEEYTGGSRSLSVQVINKSTKPSIDVNKTYNKNNYLKSLSIEGYNLNPEFNKETSEYTVELNPGTEKINITAATEENTSTIKGTGEINVSEGMNTINIIVTAENGNERTYKISAYIEEKDPIEVIIDNKKYRVVKKIELLPEKSGYQRSTIKINNFDIPTLYNEVTKINLVGVKDEEGNIKLYSYDTKTGIYSEYKEITLDLMGLYIQRIDNDKYEKVTIKINGIDVEAYKLNEIDEYYLIYGTNTSTGNTGYYLYDTKENSIIRYDSTLFDSITRKKDKYLILIIVLSCVCFLSMLFLLIEANKKKDEN